MTETNGYDRPWKSFAEQLELLTSRGMIFHDEDWAATWLQRIGYYRLSAYWYPFRVFRLEQDAGSNEIRTIRMAATLGRPPASLSRADFAAEVVNCRYGNARWLGALVASRACTIRTPA